MSIILPSTVRGGGGGCCTLFRQFGQAGSANFYSPGGGLVCTCSPIPPLQPPPPPCFQLWYFVSWQRASKILLLHFHLKKKSNNLANLWKDGALRELICSNDPPPHGRPKSHGVSTIMQDWRTWHGSVWHGCVGQLIYKCGCTMARYRVMGDRVVVDVVCGYTFVLAPVKTFGDGHLH